MRGSYVQIASWDPGPDGISSIPEGGSVLQIAIYLWNPTGDLDARVEMRRVNFIDSGNQILAEKELSVDGERAVRFHLLATDGSETLVYLLALGDRYWNSAASATCLRWTRPCSPCGLGRPRNRQGLPPRV